jgi:hypothetical protein
MAPTECYARDVHTIEKSGYGDKFHAQAKLTNLILYPKWPKGQTRRLSFFRQALGLGWVYLPVPVRVGSISLAGLTES